MAAMSSVIIVNLAANARDDAARSGVTGSSGRGRGAIRHDTPNVSVRQPHRLSRPPAATPGRLRRDAVAEARRPPRTTTGVQRFTAS